MSDQMDRLSEQLDRLTGGRITTAQLLVEVEDLIRTMPPQQSLSFQTEAVVSWRGRAAAVIEAWQLPKTIQLRMFLQQIDSGSGMQYDVGARNLVALLHEARHALRMQATGPTSVVVEAEAVFDYFDEVRGKIELARRDILFVDPYLSAEFVSRYLPHVVSGVKTRLLTSDPRHLATLLPAVELFVKQHGASIEIRSSQNLHDRFVFIDGSECYQSGASFKDGAKKAPVTLTQITDAFTAMWQTYETIWSAAKIEK